MSARFPEPTATERWARRITRAVSALLLAAVFSVVTPILAEPALRAGAIRRVRMVRASASQKPAPTARLDVPFFRQERALSCEIAALRMVLAYRGTTVSERDLLGQLPVDPAPRKGGTWGDPDEGFVGLVDGIMSKTGYGVHAGPIAALAGQYRRAETLTAATPTALAEAVSQGNPVIVWGFIPGRGKSMTWTTLGGKTIHAVDGEHTRVVIGYTGSVPEPTGFFVMDPVYREQYWKTEKFMKNWEPLGRTGVVVY